MRALAILVAVSTSDSVICIELATVEWVAWFNRHRLLEPLGYTPLAKAEANYCAQLSS